MRRLITGCAFVAVLFPPVAYAQHKGHQHHQQKQETKPVPHEHGSGIASHNNVQVEVPELPYLPGADPTVDTTPVGPAVTIETFERLAMQSPDVVQARTAVDAARGTARQAGLLPNPAIGYSADEMSGGEPAHGGQHGFFVDQVIPLGGKLGKRRDALLAAAAEAEARLEVAKFTALNTVRLAYFDALAAQQRADLERRMVALLQEAVRTSYGLYNVGQADRPDVLEIEIEARRAQVRLVTARKEVERTRAQLAIAAADPQLSFGRLEGRLEDALAIADAAALAHVLAKSPELVAARAGVERANKALRAARAERNPDLLLKGGARYNREHIELPGNDIHLGWQGFFEAGVTVPIFDRNQGNIAAAEAELRAAEADVRRVEMSIRSRHANALEGYREAARIAEAYRTEIMPRAEEAYRLYLEKYGAMMAAYPQVLISRRTLLESNLEYLEAVEKLYRAGLPLRGYLIGEVVRD